MTAWQIVCPSPTPRERHPAKKATNLNLSPPLQLHKLSSQTTVVTKGKKPRRIGPADLDDSRNRRRGGDWRRPDGLLTTAVLLVLLFFVLLGHRRDVFVAEILRVEAGSRGHHVLGRLCGNCVVGGAVRAQEHGVVRFASRYEELYGGKQNEAENNVVGCRQTRGQGDVREEYFCDSGRFGIWWCFVSVRG